VHNPICPPIEWRQGYATNQQLNVRTVGRFLLAILTMRGFVSTRHTDNNIYDIWQLFTDLLSSCSVMTVMLYFTSLLIPVFQYLIESISPRNRHHLPWPPVDEAPVEVKSMNYRPAANCAPPLLMPLTRRLNAFCSIASTYVSPTNTANLSGVWCLLSSRHQTGHTCIALYQLPTLPSQ